MTSAQQAVFVEQELMKSHQHDRAVRKQLIEDDVVQVKYTDHMVVVQVYGWTVAAPMDKKEAAQTIHDVCRTIDFLYREGKLI